MLVEQEGRLLPVPYAHTERIKAPEQVGLHKIVYVTGVTCVGKGHLLEKVKEGLDDSLLQWLNSGTILAEHFGQHRDKTRELELSQLREGLRFFEERMLQSTPAVLDAHMVPLHNGKLLILPRVYETLRPAEFVVIVSDPARIAEWREQRNQKLDRQSIIESEMQIDRHQEVILGVAKAYAKKLGSGLTLIYNIPSNEEQNVDIIRNVIGSIR